MKEKYCSGSIDHVIDGAIIGVYYLWEISGREDYALGYAQDQMYYESNTKQSIVEKDGIDEFTLKEDVRTHRAKYQPRKANTWQYDGMTHCQY